MRRDKELIIFDLDGTLALSKSAIDDEMHSLLEKLLENYKVLVISGGRWRQFESQLLGHLGLSSSQLSHMFISTGGGSTMYKFIDGEPHEMYADNLNAEEKKRIQEAFDYALPKSGYTPHEHNHGKIIEDRQSEITFSGIGQEAPLNEKNLWDPDHKKREVIVQFMKEKIPEFEVRIGGSSSIDVTKMGRDKAYGIHMASENLNIPIEKMLFVGDALYDGGNDTPAKTTGVECIQVADVEDTKKVIREILT